MCGRYTARTTDGDGLAARFGFDDRGGRVLHDTLGRADVRPTEQVAAVVADPSGARRPASLRWGLAPAWGSLRGGRPLINARDDRLATSGAWRGLASSSTTRCLVLADGWLEWQRAEDGRQPRRAFLHELDGGAPMAFAGLWCVARPKDADTAVASCTIVTVGANREAARLHDRMPAVLAGPQEEAAWLAPGVGLDEALELVAPLQAGLLRVSRAGHDGNGSHSADPQLALPL